VGGGSLVYANTLLSPPDEVFRDPRWPSDESKMPFFYESMDVMSYAYDGETTLAKVAAELGNGKVDYWQAKAESTETTDEGKKEEQPGVSCNAID
jgi:cholesterol oxidase